MLLGAWLYSAFLGLFITLFVIVSLFLILIILIQKGRGGGLASAFGGGGGNTAFGSKTGDVLTWATSIIFGIFLLLAIILNLMTRQSSKTPPVAGAGSAPVQQNSSGTSGTSGTSAGSSAGTPDLKTPIGPRPATTLPAVGPTSAPAGSPTTAPVVTPASVTPATAPKLPATRPASMPAK